MRGLSGLLLMLSPLCRATRVAAFSNPSSFNTIKCSSSSPPSTPIVRASVSSMSSRRLETVAGDGVGGSGITLVPTGGDYKNVVVWLHGLGDTASGWSASIPEFRMPNTKFILPTAPERPITLNGGMRMPGWSDIIGLSDDSPEDREGFNESAARVRSIIESEKAKGKDFSRMVVGGFSQGGAVALHVCLRSPEMLAGCIGCSSWVPLNKDYPGALSTAAKEIPVSQFHGTRDEVVRFTWGQHSHNLMKDGLGMKAEFTAIPGMGHSACGEEMEAIGDFLKKILPE